MIKKLAVLLSIIGSLAFGSLDALAATTYYVRCDGGTPAQCDGTHDAPLAGAVDGADADSLPDCAYISQNYAIGANVNTGGAAGKIVSGDTVIIDGEVHAGCTPTTSGRAQFAVGANTPNMTIGIACDPLNYPYGCILNTPVSGVDAANKTKIYGKGWDKGCPRPPQLWGRGSAYYVLPVGSYTEVKCLEITDHSSCKFRATQIKGNVDNDPSKELTVCSETYPAGIADYARVGIGLASGAHDIDLENIWIHGMAYGGIYGSSQTGNIYHSKLYIKGNSFYGYTGADNAHLTGNYYWTGGAMNFSGCGEYYPPRYPIARTRAQLRYMGDIHNCHSQDQGGYGDGLGRSAKSGNWRIIGVDFFGNVSDAIDLLYDDTGEEFASQITCEANAGQCFKTSTPESRIENSELSGNCAFWKDSPIAFGSINAVGRSGSSCNNNGLCDADENYTNCADCRSFNVCRPASHSTVSFTFTQLNSRAHLLGNTITGNSDAFIISQGANAATALIEIKNNVVIGGTDYNGRPQLTDFYFDNAGGTTLDQDYNFIAGTLNWSTDCVGANDHCYANVSSLGLVGPISNLDPTYYQGIDYLSNFALTVTSPAHGASAADETVTMQGAALDYTGFNRRSVWDGGGREYRPLLHFSTDYWNVSQ